MSKFVLHVWPPANPVGLGAIESLPSLDPLCLAAIMFCNLTIPDAFTINECTDPDLSPTGTLPFLSYEKGDVAPLSAIFSLLPLDDGLSTRQKAQKTAWNAHVEANYGDLLSHMLYSRDENWVGLTHKALVAMYPVPARYFVPLRLRDAHKPRLETAGLWDPKSPEPEEKDPAKRKPPKPKGLLQQWRESVIPGTDTFHGAFERDKVLEKARPVLDIYARLLGTQTFFFGDKLTTTDTLVAAHSLLLLHLPFPDPLLQDLLKGYPTLVAHAKAVHSRAFSSTKRSIPTTRNLLPVIPETPASPPSPETSTELDLEKAKFGWTVMAVGSFVLFSAMLGPTLRAR
ncbi:hypothetical protein C8J56DRAFT_866398 [Mycena floridula]|nr:hypothetical protein C8J56DRAFT_866398 [Mycena floridula]